jgi:hypothetical protein
LLQQEQSRRGRRRVNPAVKRILELQIQTLLQNAPRDPDKLERLFTSKEKTTQGRSNRD